MQDRIPDQSKSVLVSGFARCFTSGNPLTDAEITTRENNAVLFTNGQGEFSFYWETGKPLTMILKKEGYRTTQSATFTVSSDNASLTNISFQVPTNFIVWCFSLAMGKNEDRQHCQIAATITAYNRTLDHLPHGEPDVTVELLHENGEKAQVTPFYFGKFNRGPLQHRTNPCDRSLSKTSHDGGVIFTNVKPGKYNIVATKAGVSFPKVEVIAEPGKFINISPPLIMADKETPEAKSIPAVVTKRSALSMFFKPAIAVGAGAIGLATVGIGGAVAAAAIGYLGPQTAESLRDCCKKRK